MERSKNAFLENRLAETEVANAVDAKVIDESSHNSDKSEPVIAVTPETQLNKRKENCTSA